MNEKFQKLGFYPADILLPKDADMTKWAVVACDQFTSQPEYWQAVEETVGDAPSTLRLILPEAKLNDPDVDTHIADINGAMNRYLAEGVFQTLPGSLFYIERTQSDGKVRHGLIGAGVYASHGYERSHVDGVWNTLKVLAGYLEADGVR